MSYREIEADTPEEALRTVADGKADPSDEVLTEYSHTMGTEKWDVQDEDGNIVLDQA